MNNIKSIDTAYKGRLFRSRTEARWAVFFDTLGWEWHYELEGYDLPINGRYLPDFYFPEIDCFAEVKGLNFSEIEISKCSELHNETGKQVILLDGNPDYKTYTVTGVGGEVVLLSKEEKFYPFFYTYDFDVNYHMITSMAVDSALSKRFEFQKY